MEALAEVGVAVDAAVGREEKSIRIRSGSAVPEAYQQVVVYGPLGIEMGYVVFRGSSNVVLEMFGRDHQLRSL